MYYINISTINFSTDSYIILNHKDSRDTKTPH